MPLNLSTDNEFTPYLKYNAKAGRFYVRPQGASEDVEVVNPRLVFDMANIKTGWICYQEGAGPEKVWDPSPTQMAPRPTGPKKFKRGFEIMVVGNDQIPKIGPLGIREFSSTANAAIVSIVQMYAEYEQGMKANPGCVPFFACTGAKAVNSAYGTNFEPEFELKAWVPRSKVPALDEHVDKVPDAKPAAGYVNGAPIHDDDDPRTYDPRTGKGTGEPAPLDDNIPF